MFVGVAAVAFLPFLLFPGLTRRQFCTDIDFVQRGNASYLVVTYIVHSTGGESSDPELIGYHLEAVNVKDMKVVSEVDIKHDDDEIPTEATTMVNNDGEIYLFQKARFVQGAKGLIAKFSLSRDGILAAEGASGLDGYEPVDLSGDGNMRLKNSFEEPYCFNVKTKQLTSGHCNWLDPSWTGYSAFFMVKPTMESTRGKIWHVRTAEKIAEPKAFAGFVTEDKPGEGMDIMSDLAMNRNQIPESKLLYYQEHAASLGITLTRMQSDKTLTNFYLIDSDGKRSIWRYGTGLDGTLALVAANDRGEIEWDLPCPSPDVDFHPLEMEVVTTETETIVIANKKWAVAISKQGRSLSWQYPEKGTL